MTREYQRSVRIKQNGQLVVNGWNDLMEELKENPGLIGEMQIKLFLPNRRRKAISYLKGPVAQGLVNGYTQLGCRFDKETALFQAARDCNSRFKEQAIDQMNDGEISDLTNELIQFAAEHLGEIIN